MGTWTARNTGLAGSQNQWWLASGINASEVVVAYQPLGADNVADSYVNLVTPGVNNATPIVAPVFATATGWTFNNSEHLTTNVTGTGQHTIIIRIDTTTPVLGVTLSVSGYLGPPAQYMEVNRFLGAARRWDIGYNASTSSPVGGSPSDFVICLAANQLYIDGAILGAATGTLDTWSAGTITIANNIVGGSTKFVGNITAYAIYNRQLTSSEVNAITANMTALTSSDDPTPALPTVNYIVQNPSTRRLNSLSHELWCAASSGVFRTFDGGRGWAKIPLPDPSNTEFNDNPASTVSQLTFHWIDYDPTDNTILYALAARAAINRVWVYKATNSGVNSSDWTSRGIVVA